MGWFFVINLLQFIPLLGRNNMKKYLATILTVIVVLTLSVLSFVLGGFSLNDLQKETLIILLIVCGGSALYCFVVGQITHNNSQMDKLWSILPIAYTWIIAIKGGFNPRLVIYAVLVTLWGIRLTLNFARKGAYSLKFWAGEEDYRWQILRSQKYFKNKFVWALFNLFFISIYQNALVLAICLPSLACMGSVAPLGVFDYLATGFGFFFIIYEATADEQQMSFQTQKWAMINEGKKLEELPEPFDKGFNTVGLWNYSRHPNYLAEQAFWLVLFLFVIGAGVGKYYVFNWTMIGPLLLVLLFLGSSSMAESISASKYPEYKDYQKVVSKYIPWRKYRH